MKLVYAAVMDLFFMSKIKSTAERSGCKVVFIGNYEELIQRIEDKRPSLLIVDLNGYLTLAHIGHVKRRFDLKVVGYLSHMQVDLMKRAKGVCDKVMPQSEFAKSLPELLS